MINPLLELGKAGQAIWLDYLHRRIIENGELKRLIEEDGLKGMTSNPSIFEKAIGDGGDYDERLATALAEGDLEAGALYETLAIADIQAAADQFRPVYDRLNGADGYVSLEVSPYLAMDTEATVAEARRLWRAVDRPNLMIKIPGSNPGTPAIRRLVGEGLNINVTLLFGLDAYLAVADAHMAGLESLNAAGGDISKVHGVASFFVSRIDTQIDKEIDRRLAAGAGAAAEALRALRGKVAIANAKIAYQRYLAMLETPRWKALAAAGATPQRLLWASTGTKDPAYSDILYVETLIGPDTINTMPVKTLDAFRDHGTVRPSLTEAPGEAQDILASADRLGLDLNGVTDGLVLSGVRQFAEAFDKLLGTVAVKRVNLLGDRLNRQAIALPPELQPGVDESLERAQAEGWGRRLWAKDPTLWTGSGEADALGWLQAGRDEAIDIAALEALQVDVKASGFAHAVLLGMGGSSLGPEVLATTFGAQPGFPTLLVLDSTDPAQIHRVEAQIDPATTLFIVASKSGSTLEPDLLHRHFLALATAALGEAEAANHFIAITDAGSQLEQSARDAGLSPGLPRPAGHRRTIFRAVQFRPRARRGRRPRPSGLPGGEPAHGARLRAKRAASRKPRRRPWRRVGDAGGRRPRQGDDPGFRRHRRLRRLAGATAGGIHRQGRQGAYPSGRRAVGRLGRLRFGSAVHRPPTHRPTRYRAGRPAPGPPGPRSPRRAHCVVEPPNARSGILPLGVRNGDRRGGDRAGSVRPARRRGEQIPDPRAHRRL